MHSTYSLIRLLTMICMYVALYTVVSTESDREVATSLHASLIFGEIHFNGVTRLLDSAHLNAADVNTKSLYDLGSGCGRLCVQAFMQFPNLERVVGVELTSIRSGVGFTALKRMGKNSPRAYSGRIRLTALEQPPTLTLTVQPRSSAFSCISSSSRNQMSECSVPRILELRQGNMFDCRDAWTCDILICETNITEAMQLTFLHFLTHCKPGCRLLTYNNLEVMHQDVCNRIDVINARQERNTSATQTESKSNTRCTKPMLPWKRLAINTPVSCKAMAVTLNQQ
jgi:hypothetical protein